MNTTLFNWIKHNETISHLFEECEWSKQIWFGSSLGVAFNSHASRYVPFQEWLKTNIIDTNEDSIVNMLALCYEILCTRNKKCFEGTKIDMAVTMQKTNN